MKYQKSLYFKYDNVKREKVRWNHLKFKSNLNKIIVELFTEYGMDRYQ